MLGKKLFLHCGMHKTGSSAIQDSLFQADLPQPYEYISFGSPNGSLAISQAFDRTFKKRMNRSGRNATMEDAALARQRGLSRIRKSLSTWERDSGIISAECIATFRAGDVARLHDFLSGYCDNISVILYCRMPRSYLDSAFQQVLKKQRPTFDRKPIKLNYKDRFEALDSVFGKGNVTINWFSRGALHNGCIVQDFGKNIGLEVDPEWVVSSNQSLSLDAVKLLFIYRGVFPNWNAQADRPVLEYLFRLKSEKFSVHPVLAEKLLVSKPSEVDWIEERIGTVRPEEAAEPHPAAIRSLSDLEHPSPAALEALAETLAVPVATLGTAEEIAHALRKVTGETVS